jgi:hypothetical protein
MSNIICNNCKDLEFLDSKDCCVTRSLVCIFIPSRIVVSVRIMVGYETRHSKIGRYLDQEVVNYSRDESLPC